MGALVALVSLGCDPDPAAPDAFSSGTDAHAPGLDAPTLDAPTLDAPGLDAAGSVDATGGLDDAPGLDAPGTDSGSAIADAATFDAGSDAGPTGVPYGPFALLSGPGGWAHGPAPFTLTLNFMAPGMIVSELERCHAAGVRLVLAMTGGPHSNYITGGRFDRALWDARMDLFDTPEIRAAIAEHVANGTILAASVMDEPDHESWGGVMTPTEIDSMAAYVETIFPTLPTATVVQLDWYPSSRYSTLDYLIRQFSYDLFPHQGPNEPNAYRDQVFTQAEAQNVGVLLSMNILDGGSRVDGCPVPETGGVGTYGPNCRMTAAQVENAADALTTRGACGLLMWQSDAAYFGDPAHVAAFTRAAALLATRPRRCVR